MSRGWAGRGEGRAGRGEGRTGRSRQKRSTCKDKVQEELQVGQWGGNGGLEDIGFPKCLWSLVHP